MCLIIRRPAGGPSIPASAVANGCAANRDGAGFVMRTPDGLVARRFAPKEYGEFVKALTEASATGHEVIAHMRMGTSGPTDVSMAHPFPYTDPDGRECYALHNGVIDIAHDRKVESDTAAWVRLVLARLPADWYRNPALVFLAESSLGWNKVVVVTPDATVILNEDRGVHEGGVWYSNPGFRPVTNAWTTHSRPAVVQQAANPASKRSQKRAAAKERREARKAARIGVTAETPLVTVESPSTPLPPKGPLMLEHAGHAIEVLQAIPRDRDGEYTESVECVACGTFGDLWIVDGRAYVDISHKASALIPQDALAMAGM